MSVDTASCEHINLLYGYVVMSDGETLPITNFLNSDGDECDGDDEASAVVAGRADYGYVAVALSDEKVTLH